MSLYSQFKQHVLSKKLISSSDKILLSISGGVDSVVLADLLFRLGRELGFDLSFVHFDHGLRGKESDDDASFVKELAKRYQRPFHKRSLKSKLSSKKTNLQALARAWRYRLLESLALQKQCSLIVTAHQANDVAETFFIQMLRGKGPEAWVGLREKSVLEKNGLFLLRPLLPFSRKQILEYAQEKKILWREDSSNLKTEYLRNKIRHGLFEALHEINPKFLELFAQNLEILREEQDYLSQKMKSWLEEQKLQTQNRLSLSRTKLQQLPGVLRLRVLKESLKCIGLTYDKIKRVHLLNIQHLLLSSSPKARVTLANEIEVFVKKTELVFKRHSKRGKRSKNKFF
ncbi:MAG: tRNA lysidine(34) synthetase TilS [Deltaproteobacteria bacterium]|nr:tRNA lysidine(34) synthetase TilS [Deltaproteobacteria bacterium]